MNSLKSKKWGYVLSAMLLVLLIGICDFKPVHAAVKLNHTLATLCVGDRLGLKLSGTGKKVTWKSSNAAVAKVSSKGSVLAKKKGTATITATVSGRKYKCRITVNKTFKVDTGSVSIKDKKVINAFLAVDGSVKVKIADPDICTISFGKWDGDYMPLTIVPKKVGSTTVTFSNSYNTETCMMKVKVTALPVYATFRTPVINNGAKMFIAGENTMKFTFQLNRAASTVSLKIYDSYGDTVRKISVGKLAAKKNKSVEWDGCDQAGYPVNGEFEYAVIANGTKTIGGSQKVIGGSPFGKGDGTEGNPFLVSDMEELRLLKDYNGCYFAQDADIDMYFEAIPSLFDDTDPFVGVYDGKYDGRDHRIINLFGYNSIWGSIGSQGELKNITMSNCVLNTIGSFLAYTNQGLVENCSVTGNIVCNQGYQAALLVMVNKGQIRNCRTAGNVNVVVNNVIGSTAIKAGGIVLRNEGTIAGCSSSVALNQQMNISTYVPSCQYEIYTGGIVGENINGFVTQCTFAGSITTKVTVPDAIKDLEKEPGIIYSGYVAGNNQAYIDKNCINAGMNRELMIQGTGNGTVQ